MRLRRIKHRTAEERSRRDDDTVELTPCEDAQAGYVGEDAHAWDRCGELNTTRCDCCGLWLCEKHEHEHASISNPNPRRNS